MIQQENFQRFQERSGNRCEVGAFFRQPELLAAFGALMKIHSALCLLLVIWGSTSVVADQGCGCLSFISKDAPIKTKVEYERKNSRAVFSGEVVEVGTVKGDTSSFKGSLEVTFKLRESWKGIEEKTKTVKVITSVPKTANCGYDFKVGESYLVYVLKNKVYGEMLTNTCTRTRKLTQASEDLKALGNGKRLIG
jgi:hypothetical protein